MSERPDYQEPVPDDAEYPADEDREDIPEGSDEIVDPLDDDEEIDAPLEEEDEEEDNEYEEDDDDLEEDV